MFLRKFRNFFLNHFQTKHVIYKKKKIHITVINHKCYIKFDGLDKSNYVNYNVAKYNFPTIIQSLYPENELPT